MNKREHDLTLVSIIHSRASYDLCVKKLELIKRLNPDTEIHYLLIANFHKKDGFDENIIDQLLPQGMRVVQNSIDSSDPFFASRRASREHASGLNRALKETSTRYIFFLDPDFFIIFPNWIIEVIYKMHFKGLAFFGVPYHPARYMHHRYFPCPTAFFIDTKTIFYEKGKFETGTFGSTDIKADFREKLNFDIGYIRESLSFKEKIRRKIFPKRSYIGSSKDTSYLIYKHFSSEYKNILYKKPWRFVKPVFKFHHGIRYWIDSFLPESLSYVPKIHNSYSTIDFRELGYFSCRVNGWEEYVWRGKPFAVHFNEKRVPFSFNRLRLVFSVLDFLIEQVEHEDIHMASQIFYQRFFGEKDPWDNGRKRT